MVRLTYLPDFGLKKLYGIAGVPWKGWPRKMLVAEISSRSRRGDGRPRLVTTSKVAGGTSVGTPETLTVKLGTTTRPAAGAVTS